MAIAVKQEKEMSTYVIPWQREKTGICGEWLKQLEFPSKQAALDFCADRTRLNKRLTYWPVATATAASTCVLISVADLLNTPP
jgi:hypothetical protein